MYRYAKWFLTLGILGLISTSIYSSVGGGQNERAPFPVPLSCYSEDFESPQFMEKGCDKITNLISSYYNSYNIDHLVGVWS